MWLLLLLRNLCNVTWISPGENLLNGIMGNPGKEGPQINDGKDMKKEESLCLLNIQIYYI